MSTPGETHEDFNDDPVRCIVCGFYAEPDETISTDRGAVCGTCSEHEEAA